MVEQERDLALRAAEPRLRQRLEALADGGSGHGLGVERVGLAELARPPAGAGHQLGRHAHHPLAGSHQEALQPTGDMAAVLERPDPLLVELARPAKQPLVAGVAGPDRQLVDRLGSVRIERGGGVGSLVWVRPDHDHVSRPFVWMTTCEADRRWTCLSRGGSQAPIRSRRRSSGGGGRHNACRSDRKVDSEAKGQPTADPGPTGRVGHPRPVGPTMTLTDEARPPGGDAPQPRPPVEDAPGRSS